jgi:hypothetical protein
VSGRLTKTNPMSAMEVLRVGRTLVFTAVERAGRLLWQQTRRAVRGPDYLEQNTRAAIHQLSEPARLLLSHLQTGSLRSPELRKILVQARQHTVHVNAVISELSAAGLTDSEFPDTQFIRPELLGIVRRALRE